MPSATPRFGGDEDLLRRDVRVEEVAEQRVLAAALEFGVFDHADFEIRAVRAVIFQLRDAEVVQIGTPAGKVFVMGLPCGNGIVIYAGGGQNGFPQLFDGLVPSTDSGRASWPTQHQGRLRYTTDTCSQFGRGTDG